MAGTGTIYKRGEIFFIAYSDHGRDFARARAHARSRTPAIPEQRLAACRPGRPRPPRACRSTDLCRGYLEEYRIRQFRTPDTAGGRVENLRAFFGDGRRVDHHRPLAPVPGERRRRRGGRRHRQPRDVRVETMFRLAIAMGRLTAMPVLPAMSAGKSAATRLL